MKSDAWHNEQAALDAGAVKRNQETDWSYLHESDDAELHRIIKENDTSQRESMEANQALQILAYRNGAQWVFSCATCKHFGKLTGKCVQKKSPFYLEKPVRACWKHEYDIERDPYPELSRIED